MALTVHRVRIEPIASLLVLQRVQRGKRGIVLQLLRCDRRYRSVVT